MENMMDKDERDAFESELGMSMIELTIKGEIERKRKEEDRKRLAAQFGEVS